MSKPDKPKTPQSEKLQVAMASQQFDKGSAIKGAIGEDHLADLRDNTRSQAVSVNNAKSAKQNKMALQKLRKQKNTNVVTGSTRSGMGTGQTQVNRSGLANLSKSGMSAISDVNKARKAEQAQSMLDFTNDNMKTQQALNVVASAGNAALHHFDNGEGGWSTGGSGNSGGSNS